MTPDQVDDLLFYATLGVIIGGRLGYVTFYQPGYFISHPLEIFAVWQGGMSFHGGLCGVIAAAIYFARKIGQPMLEVGDAVACMAPIGLLFGRLANFINGELFGRVTDVPWAMVFPHGGPLPRHPSQLYEAFLEGLVLALVMLWLVRRRQAGTQLGLLGGVFLAGYGLARGFVELFREPDAHLGYLFEFVTMGQILSAPMVVIGLALIAYSRRSPATATQQHGGR